MNFSLLDPGQIIKASYDDANQALQVRSISAGLVNVPYDEVDLTYVAAGNGAGQVETVTYKQVGTTVATLTLTYDSSSRLSTVTKS